MSVIEKWNINTVKVQYEYPLIGHSFALKMFFFSLLKSNFLSIILIQIALICSLKRWHKYDSNKVDKCGFN